MIGFFETKQDGKVNNNQTFPVDQPSKMPCFMGLKINKDVNFEFSLKQSDETCKLDSLVLSFKALEKRIVTTFYYKKRERHFSLTKANPVIREYYDHIIWHEDEDHRDHYHKRFLPLSDHSHFSSKMSSLDDGRFFKFLDIAFHEAKVDNQYRKDLEQTITFFIRNPNEPGIIFSSGCYARNGGSKDIKDKLAQDEQYTQGPFQQITSLNFKPVNIKTKLSGKPHGTLTING